MGRPVGRPKTNSAMECTITFRLSRDEYSRLREFARDVDKPVSDILRQLVARLVREKR